MLLRRLIARTFWAVSRWRLVTEPAPTRPTLLIGAPHTSNWDFVLMLAITWRLDMHIRWLGKKSLFTSWRGPIMLRLGGIPVDRDAPSRVVTEVVERVRSGDVFGLVVTPDGTRKGHTHWKSGFYRIAREANMPVTLGYVDRTTMTTGLGPTIELTGDVAHDMERIRAFYADKSGVRPENRVEPRLREELAGGVGERGIAPAPDNGGLDEGRVPGPEEPSIPTLEVDQATAPRPEEEIADVLRAEPDVDDHSTRQG